MINEPEKLFYFPPDLPLEQREKNSPKVKIKWLLFLSEAKNGKVDFSPLSGNGSRLFWGEEKTSRAGRPSVSICRELTTFSMVCPTQMVTFSPLRPRHEDDDFRQEMKADKRGKKEFISQQVEGQQILT